MSNSAKLYVLRCSFELCVLNFVMIEIIPGILEKEWSEIEKKIKIIKPFAKTIHIDLLDGKFAPNTTFLDPKPFAKYSQDIFFELHMMVDNPEQYIKPFADAGFKRFIGQIENMPDIASFVAEGQLWGEVGLALDGQSGIETITVPYEDLDFLFVMTVNAGYSGQQFKKEYLEKVRAIRAKNPVTSKGVPLSIEVDGGINDETIVLAKQAGATRAVATSFLFKSQNPHEQYTLLQKACGTL